VLPPGGSRTDAPGSGELAPGAPADFAVLDLDRLDRDADPLELRGMHRSSVKQFGGLQRAWASLARGTKPLV
jgi:cytosine/adenosine deaminase-related metal-dependent hydrolase